MHESSTVIRGMVKVCPLYTVMGTGCETLHDVPSGPLPWNAVNNYVQILWQEEENVWGDICLLDLFIM